MYIINFLFCSGLAGFDNPMRDTKTEEVKRHIGQVYWVTDICTLTDGQKRYWKEGNDLRNYIYKEKLGK